MSTYKQLKKRQRKERDNYPEYFDLRIHRALSWLNISEQCEDPDSKAIILWIAFAAVYGDDIDPNLEWCDRPTETKMFSSFIQRLCDLDKQQLLGSLIWQKYSGIIRLLVDNQYVFQPFWDHLKGKKGHKPWEERFIESNKGIEMSMKSGNTAKVLNELLLRIYCLRNQIVHGGATWNSSVNRTQIKDCSNFMSYLVPATIEIMMDNPHEEEFSKKPCYPPLDPSRYDLKQKY